jgi:hypothetical protein
MLRAELKTVRDYLSGGVPDPDKLIPILRSVHAALTRVDPDYIRWRKDSERESLIATVELAANRAEELAASFEMPPERVRLTGRIWACLPRERLAQVLQVRHSGEQEVA